MRTIESEKAKKEVLIFQRVSFSLVALLGIITFSFFLIHFVPGSPAELILGEKAHPIDVQTLEKEMGLDQPLYFQYWRFLKGVFTLDLGKSIYDSQPVAQHLKQAFFPTFLLSIVALLFSALWGIPAGVLSVVYKNSAFDRIMTGICVGGFSLPVFFTAPLLIWLFAIYWSWLPVSETGGFSHFILPAGSLALPLGSALCQMSRASLLEIMDQDYIRTARAKGLKPPKIYLKHALKAALIPIITIFSLQFSALLTGTIITETIFDWPGLGLLLFQSITRRDYPVVQACVLTMACIYLLVNFMADISYAFANPRIKVFSNEKSV